MSYRFNPFTNQLDNVGKAQGYGQFVYNSSGSQSGNRFNNWSDLYAKLFEVEGNRQIVFEQNETLPAGTYNLDGVEFYSYAPGAIGGSVVTLADGFVASSWSGGMVNGVRIISVSTAPIITVNGILLFTADRGGGFETTTKEIFNIQAGSFCVIGLVSSQAGSATPTYEIVNIASTATVIFSMTGQNPILYNDSIRGAGDANIYIFSDSVDPSNKSTTHVNHTGGQNNVLGTYSSVVGYDNTTSGLTATDAQAAIDELATTTHGYYGSFHSNTTQSAANTTTAYAIIADVQDEANNISMVSDGTNLTRLTFAKAGTYNVSVSLQMNNSGTDEFAFNLWFRKNGTDIAASNSQFDVLRKRGAHNGYLVANMALIITVAATDYVQIYWQTEDTAVTIEQLAAGTTPTTPTTPSVILSAWGIA